MINGGAGAFILGVQSVSPGSGGLVDANEGLSVFNDNTVQWGQELLQVPDPALVSQARQIPFLTGDGIMYYTETGYSLEEFFLEWTPTEQACYYDNTILSPGWIFSGFGSGGQVCHLHWNEGGQTYQFGGAGAQDDYLLLSSFVSVDPTATLTATAYLHIAGGTGQVGMGQLKFESGLPLDVPEAGVMEFVSGVLFFSPADNDRRIVLIGLPNPIAPASQAGTPTEYIGNGEDIYLGLPHQWYEVDFLGMTFKIPMYAA